jgi:SAM-dependent methyltransferase
MFQSIRGEQAGVEFDRATWTSFDRYSRYGAIARCLRATLGPGTHRVLDIGDSAGYLRTFDDDLVVTALDLSLTPAPLSGTSRVQGDGTSLPFPDQAFDAVVSSDVLEHVPQEQRAAFLAELHRVTRDLMVVAAPFDTAGVAGVEELVRRYALLATSLPQEQLDEHRDNVLPDLDETGRTVRELFGEATVIGNGNLQDWLVMMLLKHQLMGRPALQPLLDGADVAYNLTLAPRDTVGPFYRHLVAARRSGTIDPGTPPQDRGADLDPAVVLGAMVSANLTEVVRQDAVPRLDDLVHKAAAQEAQLRQALDAQAALAARLETMEASLRDVQGLLHRLVRPLQVLRHPLGRGRGSGDDGPDGGLPGG